MRAVSGDRVADSDHGSWGGEDSERWEVKIEEISAGVVG